MALRVLVSAPYAMPVIDMYRSRLEAAGCQVVVAPVRERLDEEELLRLVGDVDGVICGDDQFSARVIAAAPRLKVISKWGTGIDSIDREAAARAGVRVCNTPGAFSEPVADTVLGYLLLFARRFAAMDAAIRAGRWDKPQLTSLGELVLGVVGVGNCGKAVVRRARAFGMRVLGNDVIDMPRPFLAETGVEMVPLADLLRTADFISINCDLNPTSFHLIGERELALLRPTAYLVNTSRGPVVDEPALVRFLEAGRIAGAALDVFEQEPLPADSPLRRLANCWLAPHSANSSPRAADRVHENTIRQLLEALGA